jgi:hypothetical protein
MIVSSAASKSAGWSFPMMKVPAQPSPSSSLGFLWALTQSLEHRERWHAPHTPAPCVELPERSVESHVLPKVLPFLRQHLVALPQVIFTFSAFGLGCTASLMSIVA